MEFKFSVRNKLLNYINYYSKEDNNLFLANFFLTHFQQVPQMTIYDVSESSFVSTAAISRFVKKIGFASYTDFKLAIDKSLDIHHDYSKEFIESTQQTENYLNAFTQNIIEDLQQIRNQTDLKQLSRINDLIFVANTTAIFGLEFVSLLGRHLQNKYAEMNKLVQLGMTDQEQMSIAKKMGTGDVALVFSVEGGFFYYGNKMIEILKKQGVKIIVFTQNMAPMIERTADEIFLLGEKNANTEGRIMLLYVMELLIYDYFLNHTLT